MPPVLVDAIMLGISFRIEPGSTGSIPRPWRWRWSGAWARSPSGRSTSVGSLPRTLCSWAWDLPGVFVLGGLVVRQIPFLEEQVRTVLGHADQSSGPLLVLITAVNGAAEELLFRGVAYAAIPRHPVPAAAAACAVATFATGDVMLAFAALLGIVVGLERRALGGTRAGAHPCHVVAGHALRAAVAVRLTGQRPSSSSASRTDSA